MSKSRPKSQSKSRKRSSAKEKFAPKAPMEERNSAAKTVEEPKPSSHFCWQFFLRLLSLIVELGRKLFSFGPSEKKKEPSLQRPNATSSSSALATPSTVSVAAKRASEEQRDRPAEEMLSLGTVNGKEAPISTDHSNKAMPLDPEVLEEVFSEGTACLDRVGYQKREVAEVHFLERLHENEDDDIKSERPGSGSGSWKKEDFDLKKENDHLKKEREVLDKTVLLRQMFSDLEKTKEFEVMNNEIKGKVLKLLKRETWRDGVLEMIVGKISFTKILRTMFIQKAKMSLKESFRDSAWRKRNFFPKFENGSSEYQWWEENFDPEILKKRLDILRVAARKWNPERDIFMVLKLITELNSKLHPEISEKDGVEMFRLATTICSLCSGGDSKT